MQRMAYSFGFFLGDGCLVASVAGSKSVVFRKPDRESLERVRDEIFQVFGRQYSVSPYPGQARGDYWRLACSLPAIADFFAVNTQYRREVPLEFFSASPSVKLALLAGLIDSDGSVSRSVSQSGKVQFMMDFSNTEQRLVEQFAELSEQAGIKVNPIRAKEPYGRGKKTTYEVRVNFRSAWEAGLRLTCKRKQARFEQAIAHFSASETMHTPSATADEDRVQPDAKAPG